MTKYGYSSTVGSVEYASTLALLALAALGLLAGALRRWPAGLWLAPVLLALVTLPTRGNPRFRAPIDPYLVLIASAALTSGWTARIGAGRARGCSSST